MKRYLLIFLVLVLSVLVVGAEDNPLPNDPNVNPDANACLAGGSLDGKCDGFETQTEIEWAYFCGWHLIRVEAGLMTRDAMPSNCESVLPPIIADLVCTYNNLIVRSIIVKTPVSDSLTANWQTPISGQAYLKFFDDNGVLLEADVEVSTWKYGGSATSVPSGNVYARLFNAKNDLIAEGQCKLSMLG